MRKLILVGLLVGCSSSSTLEGPGGFDSAGATSLSRAGAVTQGGGGGVPQDSGGETSAPMGGMAGAGAGGVPQDSGGETSAPMGGMAGAGAAGTGGAANPYADTWPGQTFITCTGSSVTAPFEGSVCVELTGNADTRRCVTIPSYAGEGLQTLGRYWSEFGVTITVTRNGAAPVQVGGFFAFMANTKVVFELPDGTFVKMYCR